MTVIFRFIEPATPLRPRAVLCVVIALVFLWLTASSAVADAPKQIPVALATLPPEDPQLLGAATAATDATTDANRNAVKPLSMLGRVVAPHTTELLYWTPDVSFDGAAISRGVVVANGARPGPTMCLTAVVHGDEHNGLEIVRRVLYQIDPAQLNGVVVGVPIVNLDGFRRGMRYLPDRRDLNRYFPGRKQGSAASRLAYSLFDQVLRTCDYLVDIHTGSFHRTNLPQLRGDLTNLDVLELSRRFGSTTILHNRGAVGTLRRAATDAGIPAITLETGEPMRIQDREVRQGVTAIQTAMTALKMYPRTTLSSKTASVYFESRWVRVNEGGVLISGVQLGDVVEQGARLGTVTDPVTNKATAVTAPYAGRVLGMALNQVVLPGYAAFHIGIPSTMAEAEAADELNISLKAPTDKSGPIDGSLADEVRDRDLIEHETSE
jgi:hypothetical protein